MKTSEKNIHDLQYWFNQARVEGDSETAEDLLTLILCLLITKPSKPN